MAARKTVSQLEEIIANKNTEITSLWKRLEQAATMTDEALDKLRLAESALKKEQFATAAHKEQILVLEAEKDAAWKAFEYVVDSRLS